MTPTLLLDLDDTLLGNELGKFLPVYLKALGRHLADHTPADQLVPALLAATQEMINNNRPDRTLKEVFDNCFYPSLHLDIESLQEDIDDFYATVFPKLRSLTQSRPQAVALVKYAFDRDFQVVIATNPLFPRTAILQRLEWANLSPEEYPFTLIASYETFHFAKPNPAYFAEILARLGWPEGPVLMVGDDLENDIDPSRLLGLAAFWISQDGHKPTSAEIVPTASGSLADVIEWLDSTSPEELKPRYQGKRSLVATLRATPAALGALTADLPPSAYTRRLKSGEWSLTEILCHLRDVEREVNLPRIRRVMNENDPFLPGVATDPWAQERQYLYQDGASALESFTQARLVMLDLLESLSQEDWQRSARHAIFGPTHLKELVGINAGHDRLHLQQFLKTLSIVSAQVQKV